MSVRVCAISVRGGGRQIYLPENSYAVREDMQDHSPVQ
jgi:hypothetical protein